jgi:hypothetical protein
VENHPPATIGGWRWVRWCGQVLIPSREHTPNPDPRRHLTHRENPRRVSASAGAHVARFADETFVAHRGCTPPTNTVASCSSAETRTRNAVVVGGDAACEITQTPSSVARAEPHGVMREAEWVSRTIKSPYTRVTILTLVKSVTKSGTSRYSEARFSFRRDTFGKLTLQRQLGNALRSLGRVLVSHPRAHNTSAPALASFPGLSVPQAVTESFTPATHAMAETMGDHGYDYDLIVIGGGSGGLVRPFPLKPPLDGSLVDTSFFRWPSVAHLH